MTLESILRKKFYNVIITVEQNRKTKLPYYGPIARGWLGSALLRSSKLRFQFFKNPYLDVRPFMMFTKHEGQCIDIHLKFLGFSETLIKDTLKQLPQLVDSHFGGLDCTITRLQIKRERFSCRSLGKKFKIRYLTPSCIRDSEEIQVIPDLSLLAKSLSRSINRFSRYYLKRHYPIRIESDISEIPHEITKADVSTFTWNHRQNGNKNIEQKAIMGESVFEIEEPNKELDRLFATTNFFQVGRFLSYGFGKIEAVRA